MLAAHHDQENLYTHQAGASKPQLQAKTPGARFPKTPLKVPLNDENTHHGFGGKNVLKAKGNNENILTIGKGGHVLGKGGKQALVTPAGPRTVRAPLGNKTTNAKARATQQTPAGKVILRDPQKTALKPTTAARPKLAAPKVEASKLEVHVDKDPLQVEEVEYAPPKPKEMPYESDVFPEGVLTYEGLKPGRLFKGYYQYYFNPIGEDGKTLQERDLEEQQKHCFERGEENILKDMEELDWTIGDLPESKEVLKKRTKRTPLSAASRPSAKGLLFSKSKPSTSAAPASTLPVRERPTAIDALRV